MTELKYTTGRIRIATGLRFICALVCIILLPQAVCAQKPLPELWGVRVHDEAKVLSQSTVDQLENQLRIYEDSTSNQIALFITPSLDGEVLEEYSIKLAEKWALGKKNKDNGVLLLIAVDDRKMRIEVGLGLEGVLTDAICNRIIRNEMAPNFRQDDYDGGVSAAINAIIAAIGGEYTAGDQDENSQEIGLKELIFISLFLFFVLGIFTFLGIIMPAKPGWFLYVFLIPFYAIFPMAIYGGGIGLVILVSYLVLFPILKLSVGRTEWGKRVGKKMNSGSGGGSSGSSWSSSSGGGGGFSGGGGSFGGGGSSGSW